MSAPWEEGGYEIIAGHRRKYACELAGLTAMPVIVRDMDRDSATIPKPLPDSMATHLPHCEKAQAQSVPLLRFGSK